MDRRVKHRAARQVFLTTATVAFLVASLGMVLGFFLLALGAAAVAGVLVTMVTAFLADKGWRPGLGGVVAGLAASFVVLAVLSFAQASEEVTDTSTPSPLCEQGRQCP